MNIIDHGCTIKNDIYALQFNDVIGNGMNDSNLDSVICIIKPVYLTLNVGLYNLDIHTYVMLGNLQ